MPRRRKPARLWLHPRDKIWIIKDGSTQRSTGCREAERETADEALEDYIAAKRAARKGERGADDVFVGEVLNVFLDGKASKQASAEVTAYNVLALAEYWANKTVASINYESCNEYAEARREGRINGRKVRNNIIRRELAVLSSALHYYHKTRGPLSTLPIVSLPPKDPSRERHLSRTEAARLLLAALGWYRIQWSDVGTRSTHERWSRDRDWWYQPHLARFIIIQLRTGSRPNVSLCLRYEPSADGGWIDADRMLLHRRAQGEHQTHKRKPPSRISNKLAAHVRRWRQLDQQKLGPASNLPIIHFRGRSIGRIDKAFAGACERAGVGHDVTPHVLRHTRATWLMQAGVDKWEAAGALGMSLETLERVYGHHHPDFQKDAAEV